MNFEKNSNSKLIFEIINDVYNNNRYRKVGSIPLSCSPYLCIEHHNHENLCYIVQCISDALHFYIQLCAYLMRRVIMLGYIFCIQKKKRKSIILLILNIPNESTKNTIKTAMKTFSF